MMSKGIQKLKTIDDDWDFQSMSLDISEYNLWMDEVNYRNMFNNLFRYNLANYNY